MSSFSNGKLSDNWGKERLGKQLIASVFSKCDDLLDLKDLLFKVAECRTRPEDHKPPLAFNGQVYRTAFEQEQESSIFVDAYVSEQNQQLGGTCSSSLLLVDAQDRVHYWERVYDQSEDSMQEDAVSFRLCQLAGQFELDFATCKREELYFNL